MREMLAVAGLMLLAALAGASFVLQASVNARLRVALDSPNWAALISYAGGTLVMAVVVLLARAPAALSAAAQTPWWAWTGGLCGAVYVVIIILLLPRMGSAALIALFVLGQMIASLAFDHFGLFGVPKHSINLARVAGVVFLVAGAALIRR